MRFSIAPSSIEGESSISAIVNEMLELVKKFRKFLSPYIEPILFVTFTLKMESARHYVTNEREGQFGVKGGIGKLGDGIGTRNVVFGARDDVFETRDVFGMRNGWLVELFNFLPDALPLPTSTCGELLQSRIVFAL
jgi:hypothetical protein